MKQITASLIVLMMIMITGCEKNKWEQQEQKKIDEYIKSLEDTVYVEYPSGLYYIELREGTGNLPEDNDTVFFKYNATFLNYVTFSTNYPKNVPVKYCLGSDIVYIRDINGDVSPQRIVEGLDEGLHYIRDGGKARLLLPSKIAFGFEGIWNVVPGYTPVLYTVDIDSVKAGITR